MKPKTSTNSPFIKTHLGELLKNIGALLMVLFAVLFIAEITQPGIITEFIPLSPLCGLSTGILIIGYLFSPESKSRS